MGKNQPDFWSMSAEAIPPLHRWRRIQNFNEFHPPLPGRGAAQAGRPVHGLRRALLPGGHEPVRGMVSPAVRSIT